MSKPEGPECYIPRLEMTMKEIPEEYHNFLWEYTGEGHGPQSVQAAVRYVESKASQEDVCEQFGVSGPTLRKVVGEMIDRDVICKSEITQTENAEWDCVPQYGEERAVKGGKEGAKAIHHE